MVCSSISSRASTAAGAVQQDSLWVYRFYDQTWTAFTPPLENFLERVVRKAHRHTTAKGLKIESAAERCNRGPRHCAGVRDSLVRGLTDVDIAFATSTPFR
jgi:hypothetical protein